MNKISIIAFLIFMSQTILLRADENRNVNLSWVGFLNLPKKIQKEDSLVKVKSPDLWEDWSKENYSVQWFAKPKNNYKEKIHLYFLLDQSKKETSNKMNRRWRHLNR